MVNFEKCIILLRKIAQQTNPYTKYLDGSIKNLDDVDIELQLIDSNPEYASTVNYVIDEWNDKISINQNS
jgi:hypothetical protein